VRDQLVTDLSRDYGVHPYAKWRGAHWRLASLVELDAPVGETMHRAAEDVLVWLVNPGRLRSFPKIEGRVRRCASQDGLALYVTCRLGMAGDERLETIARSLIAGQWPDGGWNCDRRAAALHSSFNESWAPILGLWAYARLTGDDEAGRASEGGADFLLGHKIFQSHRTGKPAHPAILNLRFPPYWHYDVLVGLVTLARTVGLADARAAEALDLLDSRRHPDVHGAPKVDGGSVLARRAAMSRQ
jgi:hypothetical protein